MNRNKFCAPSTWTTILAICCLAYAPLACAPVETAIVADPGTSFTLPVGKTAAVRGTDTRLTFTEVREDSRCPTDVTCVWEGDAKIAIAISQNGGAGETKVLSIRSPANETTAGNLRIRFVGLAPVPRQSDANTARQYVAQFVVERL
ncbi:MAG: hypothetical protein ACJ8AC_12465 [Gemmatimonadaceae bacterium]